jgi:hypothetical protein
LKKKYFSEFISKIIIKKTKIEKKSPETALCVSIKYGYLSRGSVMARMRLITEGEIGCRTPYKYGICYRTLFLHGFFKKAPPLPCRSLLGGRMRLPAGFADGHRSFEEIGQQTPQHKCPWIKMMPQSWALRGESTARHGTARHDAGRWCRQAERHKTVLACRRTGQAAGN